MSFWKSVIIQSLYKLGLGICLVPGMVLGPRERDLSKYNTPILNDSSQAGHSMVLWDTQGQHQTEAPQAGQESMEGGSGEASLRRWCLNRAVKEEAIKSCF